MHNSKGFSVHIAKVLLLLKWKKGGKKNAKSPISLKTIRDGECMK